MSFKSLDKLLNSSGDDPLENLVQRSRDMVELAQVLRRALPSTEAREILAANCRDDGDLVVVCRNSAFAARLRFENERLLHAAQAAGYPVARLKVRVGR